MNQQLKSSKEIYLVRKSKDSVANRMKESNLHNSRAFGSINKFNSSLSSVNSTSKE